jgi:glycine cleavage system H protein
MASVRLYTRDNVWADIQGSRARVGLSDFAQHELGEVSYVELPQSGRVVRRGEAVSAIDSLKSSSEIYAPVSGTIVEVNDLLATDEGCGRINTDPLGEGWIFVMEMSDPNETSLLLTEKDYFEFLSRG